MFPPFFYLTNYSLSLCAHTPGVINPKEVDELLFTDDVQEAFDYIVRSLEAGPLLWSTQSQPAEEPLSTMTS